MALHCGRDPLIHPAHDHRTSPRHAPVTRPGIGQQIWSFINAGGDTAVGLVTAGAGVASHAAGAVAGFADFTSNAAAACLNPAAAMACINALNSPGCSGGQSFTAATKVLLPSGKAVPIASLKPGDKVLATNTTTGKTQPEPVTAVLVNHDTDLYNLTVRVGPRTAIIHTTASHLF